jgi:hypothetical protein
MFAKLKGLAGAKVPNPLTAAKSAAGKVAGNPAQLLAAAANPGAAVAQAKKAATDAAAATALKSTGMSDAQIKAAAGLGGAAAVVTTGASFFTKITAGAKTAAIWLQGFFLNYFLYLSFIKAPPGSYWWLISLFAWFVTLAIIYGICKAAGVDLLNKKTYGFKDPVPVAKGEGSAAPTTTVTAAAATANQLAPAAAVTKPIGKEGFEDAAPITLQNAQPLTIKQVAFLGPLPEGHFDTDNGAVQALRAGFRSFIFQIDYLDTKRDENLYALPGIPTLLYRADDGGLISENSADINVVAQSIANSAFRPEVPKNTDPVVIYLHILRAPSVVRDPDNYKIFLSKIATALNPLAPMHLGMTPLGTFNRQKQEAVLLSAPLSTFEGQVIILSNADTSVFKNASPQVNPADDLDFWVNMRVYLNDSADTLGITQMPPAGVTPSAVVVKLADVLNLPSTKADAFAAQGKSRFVIALPSQMTNPTVQELDTAINLLGINMVPLDIFSDSIDNVKALVKKYDSNDFRMKPAGLRQVPKS